MCEKIFHAHFPKFLLGGIVRSMELAISNIVFTQNQAIDFRIYLAVMVVIIVDLFVFILFYLVIH